MNRRTLIVAEVSMLAAVAFSVWGTAKWADRQMRDNLLQQARLIMRLVSPEQVKTLTGGEADLTSPDYLFVKNQLMQARQVDSRYRFIYLLGRRAAEAGRQSGQHLFFFADSEPVESKDYSYPGQIYEEATEGEWRVFETKVGSAMGPAQDRWGTWVSALVPMTDPSTGRLLAVLGMDIDARLWKWNVAAYSARPVGLTLVILCSLFVVLFSLLKRSDRSLAEQQAARRTIEERLLAAIEQSGEIVLITDPKGQIQYVNPAFVHSTGYSREEAIGKNPRMIKSGQQDEAFYRELWQTITSGKIWKGRFVNKRKDGALYTEEASISPVRNEAGQISNFVAVKRDITEHLQMADQLLQAQKMESVGRLAGGVAHDFNNMLTVILGNTEMALQRENPATPLFADLQEIRKAAEHSAELTRQLLTFARKQAIVPRVIDLSEAVAGMLKMLRRLIGEGIELEWTPCDWPVVVKMDQSQVNQILANLVVNARFAIAGSGTITLATQTTMIDHAFCAKNLDARPGSYAVLIIRDTGCGMDKKTAEHIFEPFFTTKRAGEGTGLGLATVYGIVKQNGGFITVDSEPGRGTTFKIYLPRSKESAETDAFTDRLDPVRNSHETVLLVDDEPAILSMGKTMLEELGYRVLSAASPEEAIAVAGSQTEGLHLLLTDIVMPKMNGVELSQSLQAQHPRLKSLFMSGYSAEVIIQHGIKNKKMDFIQKPFTLHALEVKIREVLDSP